MVLIQLFISFFQVGLFSVGGGYAAIPLIQEQIVDERGLMSLAEFTDLITIAEMTPGSIAINVATFVGTRTAGPIGAIICTFGCILPSMIISMIMAYIYYKYRKLKGVQTVLSAMRPAIVALIASAGVSILILALFNASKSEIIPGNFKIVEAILFVAGFIIIRKFKTNPILVIFGTGIVGTVIYVIVGAI